MDPGYWSWLSQDGSPVCDEICLDSYRHSPHRPASPAMSFDSCPELDTRSHWVPAFHLPHCPVDQGVTTFLCEETLRLNNLLNNSETFTSFWAPRQYDAAQLSTHEQQVPVTPPTSPHCYALPDEEVGDDDVNVLSVRLPEHLAFSSNTSVHKNFSAEVPFDSESSPGNMPGLDASSAPDILIMTPIETSDGNSMTFRLAEATSETLESSPMVNPRTILDEFFGLAISTNDIVPLSHAVEESTHGIAPEMETAAQTTARLASQARAATVTMHDLAFEGEDPALYAAFEPNNDNSDASTEQSPDNRTCSPFSSTSSFVFVPSSNYWHPTSPIRSTIATRQPHDIPLHSMGPYFVVSDYKPVKGIPNEAENDSDSEEELEALLSQLEDEGDFDKMSIASSDATITQEIIDTWAAAKAAISATTTTLKANIQATSPTVAEHAMAADTYKEWEHIFIALQQIDDFITDS